MMPDRMERVSSAVKREVMSLLQEEVEDSRLSSVVVTRVEMTRDLRLARVYYTFEGTDQEKKEVGKALKRAAKFLRRELAKRSEMKYTPELSFREDTDEERDEAIDRLFEKIEEELGIEPEEKETEGPLGQ